jgi:hypothetical protein
MQKCQGMAARNEKNGSKRIMQKRAALAESATFCCAIRPKTPSSALAPSNPPLTILMEESEMPNSPKRDRS